MAHPLERIRNATRAQKSAAFEWLRAQALQPDNHDWFHAAVLVAELERLNCSTQVTALVQCERHKGMPITFTAIAPTAVCTVCPNCQAEAPPP